MLLPGADLHRVGPLALWDYCNILLQNTGEDQKKSYMSVESLALLFMCFSYIVLFCIIIYCQA